MYSKTSVVTDLYIKIVLSKCLTGGRDNVRDYSLSFLIHMKASEIKIPDFTFAVWKFLCYWEILWYLECERDGWTQNSWVLFLALPFTYSPWKSPSISQRIKEYRNTCSEYLKDVRNQWFRVHLTALATVMSLCVLSSHCYGFFHNLPSKQNAFSFLYSFLERKLQLGCCWHSLFQRNANHDGQRSTSQHRLPTCFGTCVSVGRNCPCVLDNAQYSVGIY
jgi:hypothetical protein